MIREGFLRKAVFIFVIFGYLSACRQIQEQPGSFSPSNELDSGIPTQPEGEISTHESSEISTLIPENSQNPPGYQVVVPELSVQRYDLPEAYKKQQLILYWRWDPGILEYLTLDGERGELLSIVGLNESSNTFSKILPPYLSDDQQTLVFILEKQLEIPCAGDQNAVEINFYMFDLWQESSWGFSFQAQDYIGSNWSLANDVFVLGDYSFCEAEAEDYMYFIPKSDPSQIIRTEKPNGWNLNLIQQDDRLLGWTSIRNCIWWNPAFASSHICKELEDLGEDGFRISRRWISDQQRPKNWLSQS